MDEQSLIIKTRPLVLSVIRELHIAQKSHEDCISMANLSVLSLFRKYGESDEFNAFVKKSVTWAILNFIRDERHFHLFDGVSLDREEKMKVEKTDENGSRPNTVWLDKNGKKRGDGYLHRKSQIGSNYEF